MFTSTTSRIVTRGLPSLTPRSSWPHDATTAASISTSPVFFTTFIHPPERSDRYSVGGRSSRYTHANGVRHLFNYQTYTRRTIIRRSLQLGDVEGAGLQQLQPGILRSDALKYRSSESNSLHRCACRNHIERCSL